VRFRNVWVRELARYRHKEYMLPDALLDAYAGDYGQDAKRSLQVRRAADGLLTANIGEGDVVLHAMSMTRFYAPAMDFECEFHFTDSKKEVEISIGGPNGSRLQKLSP